MEVGLGPCDIVSDKDPAPPPPAKKGRSTAAPNFRTMYCGQTPGWIKITLGTEVGLGPGDIVLDEDQALRLKKGAQPPIFGPCLLWPNGRPS